MNSSGILIKRVISHGTLGTTTEGIIRLKTHIRATRKCVKTEFGQIFRKNAVKRINSMCYKTGANHYKIFTLRVQNYPEFTSELA
jgi:ribosomal protein L23